MPSEQIEAMILPLMLIGMGGLTLVLSVRLLLQTSRLRSKGVQVPGRVLGHVSGDDRTKAAVFEFQTLQGEVVRVQQNISMTYNGLHQGRQVTVAYDPDDPQRADIIESKSQVGGALMFALLGGIFFLAGVGIAIGRMG